MTLVVRELEKSYGNVPALRGVDLNINSGEVCGLIGANGAGKTTLMSIICGLRSADSGSVHIGGIDARSDSNTARRQLGIAPQDLGIYPTLTVRENLKYFCQLNGVGRGDQAQRISEVADLLHLGELLDRKTLKMSGGEQRRLHTGMAMLHRPQLLLLDEPTTGVDIHTRKRLLEGIRTLAKEYGTAICYCTHYLPEVEQLGATAAIIDRGRIVARGEVRTLISERCRAAFELTFDGPPPEVEGSVAHEVQDNVLRVFHPQPALESGRFIARLGDDASRLREVEIIAPSLEAVFLAATGRRYAVDDIARSETESEPTL